MTKNKTCRHYIASRIHGLINVAIADMPKEEVLDTDVVTLNGRTTIRELLKDKVQPGLEDYLKDQFEALSEDKAEADRKEKLKGGNNGK